MADGTWNPAAITTLLSSELNALANNAGAIGVEYDNATAKLLSAWLEFTVTFESNPTAGNTVDAYLIMAMDGTNYADYTAGASGYAPWPAMIGSWVLQAKTTVHRLTLGGGMGGPIALPPTKFKVFLLNKSGVAFPASGSLVKLIPSGYKMV